MSPLRTFRNYRRKSKLDDLEKEAEGNIRLYDFDNKLYISYLSTPLIPVEDAWTQKEILEKLSEVRKNYIAGKKKLRELKDPETTNEETVC